MGDAVTASSVDKLPQLGRCVDLFRTILAQLDPATRFLLDSSKTGEGVDSWVGWVLGV